MNTKKLILCLTLVIALFTISLTPFSSQDKNACANDEIKAQVLNGDKICVDKTQLINGDSRKKRC